MRTKLATAMALVGAASPAWASAGTTDPLSPVLLGLTLVIASAILGGHIARRVGQPAVLGELLAGVVLGTAATWSPGPLAGISHSVALEAMAGIGACLLLFEVGLESTVEQMLRVGRPALAVACVGVAAPFAVGWGVSAWMLPDQSAYVHAFLGAALTATSVGITARVLQDSGAGQSAEARIILGAAVIDDVLGLLILALVAGAVQAAGGGEPVSAGGILAILAKAVIFLAGFVAVGQRMCAAIFERGARLDGARVHLVLALAFAFLAAYLATLAGLAPIVGAYAAGLVLEPKHLRPFRDRGCPDLEELLHSVTAFLVPVFFVLMGMHVDVRAFLQMETLVLASGLLAAAVIGKMACMFVVPASADGLTVALGMVPRGEVGLIFANAGLALSIGGHRLLDERTVSALVVMVIVTTLVTPPLLRWTISRAPERSARSSDHGAPEENGDPIPGLR